MRQLAALAGAHGPRGQLGQTKRCGEQIIGAGVFEDQPAPDRPAENADTRQLGAVVFVEFLLQTGHGGPHALAGFGNGQAQVLAQGIDEQTIVAREGLIEGDELGGWAQGLTAGLGPGGRHLGHQSAKVRNNHAVVVTEQRTDVVGDVHFLEL